MIHYSCDHCGKELEAAEGPRYRVKIEITQAFEPDNDADPADDRDYLQEIHETLQQMGDEALDGEDNELHLELQFDLCPQCRRKFVKNPLGRDVAQHLNFSQN